jgi:hypothetical protein
MSGRLYLRAGVWRILQDLHACAERAGGAHAFVVDNSRPSIAHWRVVCCREKLGFDWVTICPRQDLVRLLDNLKTSEKEEMTQILGLRSGKILNTRRARQAVISRDQARSWDSGLRCNEILVTRRSRQAHQQEPSEASLGYLDGRT